LPDLLHYKYMKHRKIVFVFTLLIIVLVLSYWLEGKFSKEDMQPEMVACTMDAMECPDGSFVGRSAPDCEFVCPDVEEVGAEEAESSTSTDIQMTSPAVGVVITSPLALSGQALGTWYFEASAPVEIRDWQGNTIAQSFVTAQGDWMTESFVPFTGDITFVSPYTQGDPVAWKQGSIVFKKDNPSGEPQFDDEIIIPIQFAP